MRIKIDKSPVHGHGVFAARQIDKDDEQLIYGHKVCSEYADWRYGFEHGDCLFIPYRPWKFLNHADEPNCEVSLLTDDYYLITALRDIEPGEELTINYGYTFDDDTN